MYFRFRRYSVVSGKTEAFNDFFLSYLLPIQRRHGAKGVLCTFCNSSVCAELRGSHREQDMAKVRVPPRFSIQVHNSL